MIATAMKQALNDPRVLEELKWQSSPDPADRLAWKWAAQVPEAITAVENVFSVTGLTTDDVMAQALVSNLGIIENIQRLISAAEARRRRLFGEIERYCTTFADALREAVRQVEEVEHTVIEKDQEGAERSEQSGETSSESRQRLRQHRPANNCR